MKRNAVVRIILFSILALVLVSALMGGIGMNLYNRHGIFIQKGSDAPLVLENAFSAQDIRSLKISWLSGEIVIEPADTDEITITEELFGTDRPMVLKKSGSKLIVEYCENNPISISIGSGMTKSLHIAVPRDWECDELEIDTASADVQVTDLTIREIDVETASGKTTFENCNVHSLDIDTASGDLNFTGTLEKLNFSGASARASVLVTNHPESIKMDSLSGDLNLTLPSDCGFTLDQDSLSGSKKVEFDTQEQNGRLVHGDGTCSIKMSGLSASVRISKGD